MEVRELRKRDIFSWNSKHYQVDYIQFVERWGEYVVVCKDGTGCFHTPRQSELSEAKIIIKYKKVKS